MPYRRNDALRYRAGQYLDSMTDRGPSKTDELFAALTDTASILNVYAEQETQRNKRKKLSIASSKIADEMSKATTVEDIGKVLFKSAEAANVLGMPELLQTANQLGTIKNMEVTEAKKNLLNSERAKIYEKSLAQINVLYKGEFIPMEQTPEFQNIKEMQTELQPTAYEMLYKKLGTTQEETVVPSKDGYEVMIYGSNAEGSKELIKHLKKNPDNTYDNILTADVSERGPKPFAIAKQEMDDYERNKILEKQISNTLSGIYAPQVTFMPDPTTGQLIPIVIRRDKANNVGISAWVNGKEVPYEDGMVTSPSLYKFGVEGNPLKDLMSKLTASQKLTKDAETVASTVVTDLFVQAEKYDTDLATRIQEMRGDRTTYQNDSQIMTDLIKSGEYDRFKKERLAGDDLEKKLGEGLSVNKLWWYNAKESIVDLERQWNQRLIAEDPSTIKYKPFRGHENNIITTEKIQEPDPYVIKKDSTGNLQSIHIPGIE